MPNETVRWDKPHFNNFIAIPRIAKEELTAIEFKLYAHYVDETQWKRPYKRGRRGTAQDCVLGEQSVISARAGLVSKGYINLTPTPSVDEPDEVTVRSDIWQRNSERYDSHEAQFEYVMDFISAGLTDAELVQLRELLVVQNDTASGTKTSQAGTESYHRRDDSVPDSYIDESQIDSSTGAERTGGENTSLKGGSGRRYDPLSDPANRAAAQGARQKPTPTPSATPAVIEALPLVKLLREKTGNLRPLTKAEVDLLCNSITINNARGPQLVYRGGLAEVSEIEAGFLAFAGIRADMFLNSPKISNKTMKDILANLAKLDFVPPEGTQKWPGFYTWRDQHSELCQPVAEAVAPAEEKPKSSPMTPEDIGWTEDDYIID